VKVAYFDCFHGAAGDMLLAALLDAGLERVALEAVLAALPLSGYTLEHWEAHSHHLRGSRLAVHVHAPQPPRAWADLRQMLRDSPLPERTRRMACATFERLARAEAGVHGVPVDEVHFHEVGAVDSIVDTVGVCAALELLGVERVYASALPLGQGWVQTQHGPLPVPAPATLALLAEAGAPLLPPPDPAAPGELLTPTAAALLCELAAFGQPAMRVQRVGYGLGRRAYGRPNGLRVWLGEQEPAAPADAAHEQVLELRCNLDDATGELLAYAIERLLAAGALDAWAAPLVMKKGRPATQLACLARPVAAAALAALMLRETPTLGVRWETMQRLAAAREVVSVATPWGAVRLTRKLLDGAVVASAPEYEDCAALARANQVPLAQVYAAALRAAESLPD
jgi:hypothetical protein